MNSKKLPNKLVPLKTYLDTINSICAEFNISIGELALNYANMNKFIDKIIIGVDSSNQLNENIQMIKNWNMNNDINELIGKINVKEQHLLSPINW
jgi:aryl-alcohol dehydrogenase-like predicted oxidoreductase